MVTHRSQPWMIDSHPLRSMPITPPIPQIRLFQTLTLKLQGQVHGFGQMARPCSQPSIKLTFILFVSHQSDINSCNTAILKFYLEKSKVKVMSEVKGQGHIVHPVYNRCMSVSFHINRTNHSWGMSNSVWLWKKKNIQNFQRKFGKKTNFNKMLPKYYQVISMTREILQ